jgi:RNA polymerase sigma-70 factor (ECF subfamily)
VTTTPLHLRGLAGHPAGAWADERADERAEAAAGSDEALAARVAAGDVAAFERLVATYRDRIHQFILWHPGVTEAIAEDITQEVFFQLYRTADRFRRRSTFRTWLYSLARNVCHNQMRRHRRFARGRADLQPETALAGLADGRPGPDARCERSEAAQRVGAAVRRLPERLRAVLLLREWEDLSYPEIASVLGVPVGTVRSRLHKAREVLAGQLGDAG